MPTALVTGASSGIGRELARALARRDHDPILTARSEDALERLAEELRHDHRVRATVLPADLSNDAGTRRLLDDVRALDAPVDVLVNNAGFATYGRFDRIEADRDMDLLRVNVLAPTRLAKALLPGMLSRDRGGILNVASTAAFVPGPRMAAYYASKAYLLHLSDALAEECRGSRVTITALCPGPTVSGFRDRAGAAGARLWLQGRPFLSRPEVVAEAGVRAFGRGQRVYVPGTIHRLTTLLPRLGPRAWAAWTVARVNDPIRDDDADADGSASAS